MSKRSQPVAKWETPRARREGGALFIHVPIEPPGLNGPNGQLRAGWQRRRKHAKRIEEMLALALAETTKEPPLERARIEYVRSYRGRPMDAEDNLRASLKPVLDALQRLGVIVSDAPEHLTLAASQTKRAGRGPFFQLKIEAIA